MCPNCKKNADILAKPTAIPGFLIGEDNDPYYTLQREFRKYSSLKTYLSEKHPEQVTASKQYYTLYEILELIEKIVDNEKLYDNNNPGLIIGDKDFASGLNTGLVLTSDVHKFVVKQLHLTDTSQEYLKKDEPNLKPHSEEHDWAYLPKWASDEATMVKAIKATTMTIEQYRLWEVKPKLRDFMHAQENNRHKRSIFRFDEIVMTIVKSIRESKYTKFDENNHTTVTITEDLLKDALEVTAFDQTQLISLVHLQLVRHNKDVHPDVQEMMYRTMEALNRFNQGRNANNQPSVFFMANF